MEFKWNKIIDSLIVLILLILFLLDNFYWLSDLHLFKPSGSFGYDTTRRVEVTISLMIIFIGIITFFSYFFEGKSMIFGLIMKMFNFGRATPNNVVPFVGIGVIVFGIFSWFHSN